MIPLALAPQTPGLAVAGAGAAAVRRLHALRAAGAQTLRVYSTDPELAAVAGTHLVPHLPQDDDWAEIRLLWITGLPEAEAAPLAIAARAARVLVNTEDLPAYCDFHSVAEIRRGDLLLTVSTGGTAPGLATALRKRLESCFPAAWAAHLKEISTLRRLWRQQGATMAETTAKIETLMAERCWVNCPHQP